MLRVRCHHHRGRVMIRFIKAERLKDLEVKEQRLHVICGFANDVKNCHMVKGELPEVISFVAMVIEALRTGRRFGYQDFREKVGLK